jgi:hypothetical protein
MQRRRAAQDFARQPKDADIAPSLLALDGILRRHCRRDPADDGGRLNPNADGDPERLRVPRRPPGSSMPISPGSICQRHSSRLPSAKTQ